eukprot:GFUD01002587.1.p1 GENE.GFUD01002587.1~~GFUD01002587.1.p1  ORF type:complete len:528 (+),score=101.25 GFUD01002587.1:150-1586(+)
MLEQVLRDQEEEEETCILMPDMSPSALDLILALAYNGWIGGLSPVNIGQVREACTLLNVRQEEFIVRAEERREMVVESQEKNNALMAHEAANTEICDNEKALKQGCFQCDICAKTFIYAKSYERHVESCQTTETVFEDIIIKPVPIKRKRTAPSRSEDDTPEDVSDSQAGPVFKFQHFSAEGDLYYCRFPGCNYQEAFKTSGGCKNHQLRQHATEEEKRFSCKFCDQKFASNQLRNKHQNLMHNKRFPCDQCSKVFSEKTRLMIHSRIHSGEKPFVCESCGFSCSQRDNLRLHKEFKHPSLGQQEKKFTCDICSASFLTKSNLARHSITHTDLKQYVCETCGKAFKDPGALKQHTFSHGAADYPCDICGQRFTSPLYLSRHMVRLHPADGIQPLTCVSCGRGFPLNHQLQEHIQAVHHNVKHCCPHCNMAIGRRSSVNRHIKKGRCKGVSNDLELPVTSAQLSQMTLMALPQLSSLTG